MSEEAKAAAEKIWNTLKHEVEVLAEKISALYAAAGSTRHCRHINELWHPEKAGVGIGFVPPEAREILEPLIVNSGLHIHKSQGPLGKNMYFSLLNDGQLTPERLSYLSGMVERKTLELLDAPRPTPKPAPAAAETVVEEQVARVEGFTVARGDKLRTRPSEVATVVDAFNGATVDMTPLLVLNYLKQAIMYFENLPDISRKEILRTITMMEDAEKQD